MHNTQNNYVPSFDEKTRYGSNSVYPLDQKPYYGSSSEMRMVMDVPKGNIAVPIEFGDLSKFHSDSKNLEKLEKDLVSLNKPDDLNAIFAKEE